MGQARSGLLLVAIMLLQACGKRKRRQTLGSVPANNTEPSQLLYMKDALSSSSGLDKKVTRTR